MQDADLADQMAASAAAIIKVTADNLAGTELTDSTDPVSSIKLTTALARAATNCSAECDGEPGSFTIRAGDKVYELNDVRLGQLDQLSPAALVLVASRIARLNQLHDVNKAARAKAQHTRSPQAVSTKVERTEKQLGTGNLLSADEVRGVPLPDDAAAAAASAVPQGPSREAPYLAVWTWSQEAWAWKTYR